MTYSSPRNKVVLIVDDEPANIHALGRVIKEEHRVIVATSGTEALEMLQASSPSPLPDLILLDIQMPDMDGYEVCRRLKSSEYSADIPVIFVTARTTTQDQEHGFKVGAVDYITKPFIPAIVQARVRTHLELSHKTRELAQKSAELARSNAELENFAYAVSHDMRQPLRMVYSHLHVLEKRVAERLGPDERKFIEYARDGAKRMDSMIVALLEYSRVGRLSAPREEIASRETLNEALGFLGPEIDNSGAKIEVTGEWPHLRASRDELTRMLQNLIGNALKYRREDAVPEITVRSGVEGGQWRVEVIDNGIGIARGNDDKLFKVFSRLQTGEKYQGHGVGLALCRRIVEHHGGEIGMESEGEGSGSVFWFKLPIHQEAA